MKVSLVVPNDFSIKSNSGWAFINGGIRYVLDSLCGKNTYYTIPTNDRCEESLNALDISDLVVIGGNPRFNTSSKSLYMDVGMWDDLLFTKSKIVDAWNGSANSIADLTNSERINNIIKVQKTNKLINYARICKLVIVRDIVLYEILRKHVDNLYFLHCCSWWAKDYYNIKPQEKKYNTIVLRQLEGDEWIIELLIEFSKYLSPSRIIVTNITDWKWVREYSTYNKIELVNDPIELLNIFAETDKLISLRVHATIPAMSLGAQVCNIYMDSRYLTCDKFGIESISFWELKKPDFVPKFSYPTDIPKLEDAVLAFKSIL